MMISPNLPRLSSLDGRQLFILRGDLRSRTGYARAARALIKLLPQHLNVIGVDIHPDPDDHGEAPGCTVAQDDALLTLIENAARPPIILHYSAPDDFRFFPGAINIGSFYWETNAVPLNRSWDWKLNLMQAMWAPTRFMADFIRSAGFRGDIDLVTWPHDFTATPASVASTDDLPLQYVQMANAPSQPPSMAPISFRSLRRQTRNLFLAVQSLSPRKGTRFLLNEWRSYLRGGAVGDVLLLRLAFRHALDYQGAPSLHFGSMLRDAGFEAGEPTQIALASDALDEEALADVYKKCDAYVTASFGEGFGGPVIEALQQDCLVIAPRHTGIQDLLAEDNPLAVDSRSMVVGLKGNLPVYPMSANWHVPVPGGIAKAIRLFAHMSAEQRATALQAAHRHASAFCSQPVVRQQLCAALQRLESIRLRSATQPQGAVA